MQRQFAIVTVLFIVIERGDLWFDKDARLRHVDQSLLPHVNKVLHSLVVLIQLWVQLY